MSVPPRRQVHLDFHTSAASSDIGSKFRPDEFARTMADAAVDSVLLFSRCHHGWVYYDSVEFPERKHPELGFDLLRAQIDALHSVGINTPVYTTVQWDNFTCDEHPEWRIVHADGQLEGTPPYEAGFYRKLCLNTPYRDLVMRQARELLERYDCDGLYFDFIRPDDCSCPWCRRSMTRRGLDPTDRATRLAFGLDVINSFEKEITAFVRAISPDCPVTFNGGHVGLRHRDQLDAYSHFELETLPSGGWGYMYFPITQRFARTLAPTMGTTGRFHTTWGDFRSYKNPAALQFEAFRMLSLGASVCVGDQLDPSGQLDAEVYSLVGSVFRSVKEREPWCVGAVPLVDIGVLHPEEFLGGGTRDLPMGIEGVTRLLEEGGHQFDVIHTGSDLSRYAVLVLPDRIPVEGTFAERVGDYLRRGGRLIASFASGMDREQTGFTLDELGARLTGPGPRHTDGELARGRVFERNDYANYLRPNDHLVPDLAGRDLAMFIRGMDVARTGVADVLAEVVPSTFDRSWAHFSSHLQSPPAEQPAGPAIVASKGTVYFAHPIFQQYETNAPLWVKQLFLGAVGRLLPEPLVGHDGPSTLRVTLNQQVKERRLVLHLLHYVPERRGRDFDTVEDVIDLHDLGVDVRLDSGSQVLAVTLEPGGDRLDFSCSGRRVSFRVPRVSGHQMVVLQLG